MQGADSPNAIASDLRKLGARRIAIDGMDGSGKSTLARTVGLELGAQVFHLDDYVLKNRTAYIANLEVERLKHALSLHAFFVLEGICVLQALELLSVEADALVYVKRMQHGYWCDEEELNPSGSIEEHLVQLHAMIQPMAKALGESGDLGLAEEVIRYHASYRPHERASLVYLRTDADA